MNTKLSIKWDGSAPGVSENRLSLDAFAASLDLLLKALRRIASNLLTEATGDSVKGRLHRDAKLLDIEIAGVVGGSVELETVVTLLEPRGVNLSLVENLTYRASDALLQAIQDESRGKYVNAAVRKYLGSLPPGLQRQEYVFSSNGTERSVVIDEVKLPEQPIETPYLSTVTGQLTGVGFEPGEPFVRLTVDGKSITANATSEQVEAALSLRDKTVEAFMVANEKSSNRLLNLRDAGVALEPMKETEEYLLYGKWSGLLKRLAQ